jgi:hypothetical protein
MSASQTFAGENEGDGNSEECRAQREHHDIQHRCLRARVMRDGSNIGSAASICDGEMRTGI